MVLNTSFIQYINHIISYSAPFPIQGDKTTKKASKTNTASASLSPHGRLTGTDYTHNVLTDYYIEVYSV